MNMSKPPLTAKAKVRRLAAILENHAAWEKRTLADLRVAGYRFVTVEQAFRYRKAQLTLARMEPDELIEFVAEQQTTNKREESI